jgi:hypothetical protein
MKSAVNEIENKIKQNQRGKIYFAADFTTFGTQKSINKALERLTTSGFLVRLAQGIYLYPKIDTKLGLGILYPSLETIANEIAKRDKARIVPTGDYALHVLGLSSQIPLNVVFLTDGTARNISIGNGKGILFKRTVPKNLSFKSERLMLVASALKEIGNGNVTVQQLEKIRFILLQEDKLKIHGDLVLLPAWIRKILVSINGLEI